MTELTQERRDELRRLATRAAPGADTVSPLDDVRVSPCIDVDPRRLAEFIVACSPETIIALLDALDVRDAALGRLRAALERLLATAKEVRIVNTREFYLHLEDRMVEVEVILSGEASGVSAEPAARALAGTSGSAAESSHASSPAAAPDALREIVEAAVRAGWESDSVFGLPALPPLPGQVAAIAARILKKHGGPLAQNDALGAEWQAAFTALVANVHETEKPQEMRHWMPDLGVVVTVRAEHAFVEGSPIPTEAKPEGGSGG